MKLVNLGCGQSYHSDWINIDCKPTGPGVIVHDLGAGLPFADGEVDAVYSSHLLEHFPKWQAPEFLRECLRVLKPGGILRVAVPDLEQLMRMYPILLERAKSGDKEAEGAYDWIMQELFDQMVRNVPGGDFVKHLTRQPLHAESFILSRAGREAAEVLHFLRDPANADKVSRLRFSDESKLTAQQIGEFRTSGEVHQWMYDSFSLARLLAETGFSDPRTVTATGSAIPDFASYNLDTDEHGTVKKPDSLFMEATR